MWHPCPQSRNLLRCVHICDEQHRWQNSILFHPIGDLEWLCRDVTPSDLNYFLADMHLQQLSANQRAEIPLQKQAEQLWVLDIVQLLRLIIMYSLTVAFIMSVL